MLQISKVQYYQHRSKERSVHTLEDDQKATYDFTENTSSANSPVLDAPIDKVEATPKIVHVLEEDVEEEASEDGFGSRQRDLIKNTRGDI